MDYMRINQERKLAYKDFENMDIDIIASALDLLADDSTQFNLQDGESFYVDCENAQVKALIEDLFFKTLNIEEHLWAIVRGFAKYGDLFVRVVGEDDVGVKYLDFSLHPGRITRVDSEGAIKQFFVDENVTLNPWDLVHFKLFGRDQFDKREEQFHATTKEDLNRTENVNTYGESVIAKARRVWRQLQLLEDSLVLTRLSRAMKRNIFSVNTQGLTETAGWDLVDKIAALLKRQKVVAQGQGMESYSGLMNPEEDIIIPVHADKGTVTVQELGGDADIQHIADIDYLNNKLFAALKIPQPYLGFLEALNGRNTLRMLDVRYARTIKNLQRVLILGLERIARIHLAMLGRDPFAVDFVIKMTYISTIEEEERTESMSNKVDAVTKILQGFDQIDPDGEIVDKTEMARYLMAELNFGNDEIVKFIKPKREMKTPEDNR
jgi:hypothetical protein